MSEILSEKRTTARKSHPCETCDATAVQPGEQYRRVSLIVDGSIVTWVQCRQCRALISRVIDWMGPDGDEGASRDDFVEWAREHPDDTDAIAWRGRLRSSAAEALGA